MDFTPVLPTASYAHTEMLCAPDATFLVFQLRFRLAEELVLTKVSSMYNSSRVTPMLSFALAETTTLERPVMEDPSAGLLMAATGAVVSTELATVTVSWSEISMQSDFTRNVGPSMNKGMHLAEHPLSF